VFNLFREYIIWQQYHFTTNMAPMAIDVTFSGSAPGDLNANREVEDVVVAGAGPAGLMLAYVKSQQPRQSCHTDASSIARRWPVMA